MNTISVRKARADEINWINSCYKEIGFIPSEYEKEYLAIAEIQGEKSGIGRLIHVDESNQELGGIYVLPAYRGRGVAGALVAFLLQNRDQSSHLYCLPFSSLASFYRSFGLEEVKNDQFISSTPPIPLQIIEKHRWCNDTYKDQTLLFRLMK